MSHNHIYEMNNELPLSHSHHAYLASYPPERRNKDYRARPRNYVAGFPVFRKDAYSRHLANIKSVLNEEEAPVIKYGKIFAKGTIVSAVAYSLLAENQTNEFRQRISSNTFNNYNTFSPKQLFRSVYKGKTGGFAIVAGGMITLFYFIKNMLK